MVADRRVVVTGKIAGETRQTAEQKLREAGAIVQSAVNKDTDVLVIGSAVGAKKMNAARDLGVVIVPWEEAFGSASGINAPSGSPCADARWCTSGPRCCASRRPTSRRGPAGSSRSSGTATAELPRSRTARCPSSRGRASRISRRDSRGSSRSSRASGIACSTGNSWRSPAISHFRGRWQGVRRRPCRRSLHRLRRARGRGRERDPSDTRRSTRPSL